MKKFFKDYLNYLDNNFSTFDALTCSLFVFLFFKFNLNISNGLLSTFKYIMLFYLCLFIIIIFISFVDFIISKIPGDKK